MIFDTNGDILIHQSWLDDANRCPERGRLGIMKPEWDGPSDATTLGTGAHAAVEGVLNGLSHSEARKLIAPAIDEELASPNMRWNKYENRAELIHRAQLCFDVWHKEIRPQLPTPGSPEVKFKVELFELPDGRKVFIEGTIDYVPHETNALWDWKFPGRDYKVEEKQKFAIQPTIYGLAAVKGGLASVTDFEFHWPLPFTYGIGVTLATKARAQTFTVWRTQAHANFAIERIKGFVDLALNFTLERPWPRNDDHFLCSDKWCPWWAICKGAHLTWQHDRLHTVMSD